MFIEYLKRYKHVNNTIYDVGYRHSVTQSLGKKLIKDKIAKKVESVKRPKS